MSSARQVPHAVYDAQKAPFIHVRELGRGAFAVVDEVTTPQWTQELGHNFDRKTYARKILKVSRRQREHAIRTEISIAVKLRHCHLVEVAMTYEERPTNIWEIQCFGMIMSPVAQCTLKDFLDVTEEQQDDQQKNCIGRWFACLASGLVYLHSNNIKHKDIKPTNILVRDSCVLFSDFGVSRFIAPEADTQTEGPPGRLTYKYAAPEVIAHDFRGRKADVFSLGCVFAEMLVVFCGQTRSTFEGYRGPPGQRAFHETLDTTLQYLFLLQPQTVGYERYCYAATIPDPRRRISSYDLEKWITCRRDNLPMWEKNRGCMCLGSDPAGNFRTVSLGEGPCEPPYSDTSSGETEMSWQRALNFWIVECDWCQDTAWTVPQLLNVKRPTLAGQFSVDTERFWTAY